MAKLKGIMFSAEDLVEMTTDDFVEQIKLADVNETININGSKVFVENGEVKTILSDAIHESGYMSVEESKWLTIAEVTKIYQLN